MREKFFPQKLFTPSKLKDTMEGKRIFYAPATWTSSSSINQIQHSMYPNPVYVVRVLTLSFNSKQANVQIARATSQERLYIQSLPIII